MEYYAGMFHIDKSEFDYIEKKIQEYEVGGFMIGLELAPYNHYHILAQFPSKKYWTNFQKHLIERYDLRGKASTGKPRQYGAISTIKDLEKLKSYTIKDGNYRSNMEKSELEKYFEKSFKKENEKSVADDLIIYLDGLDENPFEMEYIMMSCSTIKAQSKTIYYEEKIKKLIIGYCLDNNIKTSRVKVNNWLIQYIERTNRLNRQNKIEYLYKLY